MILPPLDTYRLQSIRTVVKDNEILSLYIPDKIQKPTQLPFHHNPFQPLCPTPARSSLPTERQREERGHALQRQWLRHPSPDDTGEEIPITVIDEVDVRIMIQSAQDPGPIPSVREDMMCK